MKMKLLVMTVLMVSLLGLAGCFDEDDYPWGYYPGYYGYYGPGYGYGGWWGDGDWDDYPHYRHWGRDDWGPVWRHRHFDRDDWIVPERGRTLRFNEARSARGPAFARNEFRGGFGSGFQGGGFPGGAGGFHGDGRRR